MESKINEEDLDSKLWLSFMPIKWYNYSNLNVNKTYNWNYKIMKNGCANHENEILKWINILCLITLTSFVNS